MLTMTHDAAEMVTAAREQQQLPEHFGLRVFQQAAEDGVQVRLAFSESPQEGDRVAEFEGQRLFVAPELAEPLEDAVLDTQETPEGVGIVIRPA